MTAEDDLLRAVAQLKHEVEMLASESLAHSIILQLLMKNVGDATPGLRPLVIKSFDDAADFAESLSIARGKDAAHLPETLRIIEQLRRNLTGKSKPSDLV